MRRLTDQKGQKLQQIVRRGSTDSARDDAVGNKDTVRDVIHRFNEIGLACLDPQCAGGRPRRLSPDDEDFVIQTATTRPPSSASPSPAGPCASPGCSHIRSVCTRSTPTSRLRDIFGTGAVGYSVCMIDATENGAGGTALGSFYSTNRIIEKDKFFMKIV
ncbi:helix-turn-helix domain-containing protein [Streptomyces sp. NBC_00445]|uniref:helix-turn-helix domain-containing protein n=1 Tax=Streptomyces sp. NBC_00445 TaxID=2975745 RepID=UPI003FCE2803